MPQEVARYIIDCRACGPQRRVYRVRHGGKNSQADWARLEAAIARHEKSTVHGMKTWVAIERAEEYGL